MGFRRLFVNLQIASVYRLGPVVKEVSLDGLRVRVVRTQATPESFGDLGAYNFSDILARIEAMPKGPPAPPADPNAPPPRFSINNIRITDGAVTYDDRPLAVHHELSAFTLGVPFASTLPVYIDSFVQPGISLKVDGTPFEAHGRTKPFKDSLETVLELRLDDLDLTRYVPFVPMALPFSVESALLRVALDVSFVRPNVDAPSLSLRGTLGVHDVDVREKRPGGLAPLVHLGKFEVAIGDANLTAQKFRVDSVHLAGLDVHVRRQRDGEVNLLRMIPAAPAAPTRGPKKTPPGRPGKGTEDQAPAAKSPSAPAAAAGAGAGAGPAFSVASIKLDGIKVHFEDQTTSPAFSTLVDDVSLTIAGLSNAPQAKAATVQLGLRATPGGTVAHNGTLSLAPALRAAGTLTVDGIEPGRLAPYYHDLLAFDVVRGRVRLGAGYQFVAGARAADSPSVKLEHAFVELADFALRRTGRRDEFVRLGELAVRETDVDLSRRTVRVGQIATRDARIRAERDEKGVVDLTTLVVDQKTTAAGGKPRTEEPAPAPEAAAQPEAPWLVEVAKFDLTKWGLRFSDRGARPRAELAIEPLEAHLSKLSTAPGAQLGFNVRMGINRTGTLTLAGTAAYQPAVRAKLRFDLKGLQVVPFQPYFADQVNLTVTDGAIGLSGQANVELPPAPPARRGVDAAAPEPRIQATADLGVTDFAAVDRGAGEKLVGWKAFRIVGADVKTAPLVARVKEIGLDGLDAKLTVFADGRMNLAEAFARQGPGRRLPRRQAARQRVPRGARRKAKERRT